MKQTVAFSSLASLATAPPFGTSTDSTNQCFLSKHTPKFLFRTSGDLSFVGLGQLHPKDSVDKGKPGPRLYSVDELTSASASEAINLHTKMCFCESDGGHSAPARPVELSSHVPRGIQQVETLEDLDYLIYDAGSEPDPTDNSLDNRGINYFTIYHVEPAPSDAYIVLIGGREETGLLVVKEIYLDRDPRPSRERPLAAAVVLSFWHTQLGQPIEALRKMYFEKVTEDILDDARKETYENMNAYLGQELIVSRRGEDAIERDAFDKIYKRTPFGKCARTMVRQNPAMIHAGIEVSRFEFLPADESGFRFHFIVVFRAGSAHHHPRRGHGRRS